MTQWASLMLITLHRWSGVGRRRVFHTDPEMLTRVLTFPTHALHEREIHDDGAFFMHGACHFTTPAIPAFIRKEDERRPAFRGMGHEHIYRTGVHTGITCRTYVRIKQDGPVGGD